MTPPQTHILIVDDERHIRTTLRMLLETEGYEVDTANDGEEALEKCRDQHYAIALIDLQMPKMGGLALLRRLHGLTAETAVVILTAYGSVSSAVEALKLGAVEFLEKPFDPHTIKLLIQEILLRQRLQSRGSVDDLLRLGALARHRRAYPEARAYLKTALLRDPGRPEPYYWLGHLCEYEEDVRRAAHYYYMALDVDHAFQPARDALLRLGRLTSTAQ
ncbi:MAG TPA: response regulator [Methylomirabilota bacterium]|jgi:DNA-binding response OmpR family regulator|nr:response regulator [Methylomirabilota bacterium]